MTAPVPQAKGFGHEPGAERILSREFGVLAVATSAFFLCAGALNSLLPTYVVDVLGGTETTAGVVMGSFAVSALFTRPWFGRFSDRHGTRVIMVVGACFASVSLLVLASATDLGVTFASRILFGLGGAGVMVGATTAAMDLAPEHRRSEAASYVLIAIHVGLGTGPLLAEPLREATSYRTVWLAVAAVAAVGAVVTTALPRIVHDVDDQAGPAPLVNAAGLAPGAVTFLGVFAFNGFLTFAPLYAREVGLAEVGPVFAIASFTMVAVRITLGRVPDALGPVRAGGGALVLTVGAAALVALWATPMGMYVGAALLACGLSLQSPSFMAMAIAGVPARERGSAMATYTGAFDLANSTVGPTLGLIIASVGYRSAFGFTGVLAACGLVVLLTIAGPQWQRRRGDDA